jgi:hypothetical protein
MPLWRYFLMVHVKDKADELVSGTIYIVHWAEAEAFLSGEAGPG